MTRSSQRQLSPQASEPSTPKTPVSQKTVQPNGTASQPTTTQPTAAMQEIENSERPIREKLKNTSIAAAAQNPKSPLSLTSDTTMTDDDSPIMANATVETRQKESGSLKKKRSFEDMEAADNSESTSVHTEKHVRKRSKSSEPEDSDGEPTDTTETGTSTQHAIANGSKDKQTAQAQQPSTPTRDTEASSRDTIDNLASPKNKRSREEFLQDHSNDKARSTGESAGRNTTSDTTVGDVVADKGTPSGEPKSKRHRDSDSPQSEGEKTETATEAATTATATKIPSASGLADTSAASPFSTLSGSKSPTEQPATSASAFAKSGFSTFASSSSSPFGAAGAKVAEGSRSPFAVGGSDRPALATLGSAHSSTVPSSTAGESKGIGGAGSNDKSPFATEGTSKTSVFGSGTSGFGGLSGGLSSFASKPGTSTFGPSKSAPAFSRVADDDEEGEAADDGAEGDEIPAVNGADKQDERFHVQDVNTGEDDESTLFQSRAKLYAFMVAEGLEEKTWKERGLGTVKLNVSKLDDEKSEEPQKVRLIMRADGSQRVLLNTPILKDIKFGDAKGEKPAGQTMLFRGTIDEKPELDLLQLKMKPANAVELWQQIMELQEDM